MLRSLALSIGLSLAIAAWLFAAGIYQSALLASRPHLARHTSGFLSRANLEPSETIALENGEIDHPKSR